MIRLAGRAPAATVLRRRSNAVGALPINTTGAGTDTFSFNDDQARWIPSAVRVDPFGA
jgi:hypothetical protein